MADQHRWFKFWCSAPSDDALQALPVPLRWAWVAFGAYTKLHGTSGRITVSPTNAVLAAELGVTVDALIETLKMLPHVHVEEGKNRHGGVTVTWQNWIKYQEDSTQAQRQRTSRSKRRGEENRRDETRSNPPIVPPKGDVVVSDFEVFWAAYPKKVGKDAALKAWTKRKGNSLLAEIMAGLERTRGHLMRDGGQYVPNPATWLNQGRWKDDPPRRSTVDGKTEDAVRGFLEMT